MLEPHIALLGPPGAGKTTVAQYLRDAHGYYRVAFAGLHKGGVRDVVQRIWGLEATQDREKLDLVGEVVRNYDPLAWVNAAMREIDWVEGPVVVDDLRSPAEWHALRARGFMMVRVSAPWDVRVDRLKASGKFQNLEQLDAPLHHMLDDSTAFPADHDLWNGRDPAAAEERITEILNAERRKRA